MSGFNLPPGCSVSDLPGNTPEDQAAEALSDALYEIVGEMVSEEVIEKLSTLVGKAWSDGYAQGQSDMAMAQEEPLVVGFHYEEPEAESEEVDERLL